MTPDYDASSKTIQGLQLDYYYSLGYCCCHGEFMGLAVNTLGNTHMSERTFISKYAAFFVPPNAFLIVTHKEHIGDLEKPAF